MIKVWTKYIETKLDIDKAEKQYRCLAFNDFCRRQDKNRNGNVTVVYSDELMNETG